MTEEIREVRIATIGSISVFDEFLGEIEGHDSFTVSSRYSDLIEIDEADFDVLLISDRSLVPLIREHVESAVLFVTDKFDETLVDEMTSAHTDDIVILPQSPEMFLFTVRKAMAHRKSLTDARGSRRSVGRSGLAGSAGNRPTKVVAVTSNKGGAGSTTIATNVAVAASAVAGLKVLLIDADVVDGDASLYLGVAPKTSIADLALAHGSIDPIRVLGYTTQINSRLDLLAAAENPMEGIAVTPDRMLDIFSAVRGIWDLVIIDTPSGTGRETLAALDRSDRVLMVTSNDAASIKATGRALDMLKKCQYPVNRIDCVLNRANCVAGFKSQDVSQAIGRRIVAELPSSATMIKALNSGRPIVEVAPSHEFSSGIDELLALLLPEVEVVSQRSYGGWFTKRSRRNAARQSLFGRLAN